ncbi:hypothetical protein Hdeb2414_s0015g00450101 [Helianthus debilis subsp. tardiflorus]
MVYIGECDAPWHWWYNYLIIQGNNYDFQLLEDLNEEEAELLFVLPFNF